MILHKSDLTFRPALPGDESLMARAHLESFIDGYSCPELFISPNITGHFAHRSRFERRKVDYWAEIIREETPDTVLDQEVLVAKTREGRIVGLGHAVVMWCAEVGNYIELDALYLRAEAWGIRAGSEIYNLMLGRLASRHPEVKEARACVAPYGLGWNFYNRPIGENGEVAWRDIGEVPADDCGGFFGTYFGVPALRNMRLDLTKYPILT